jgi:hypothetical protein
MTGVEAILELAKAVERLASVADFGLGIVVAILILFLLFKKMG